MPFAVMRRKYPLLKFAIPLALLLALVGFYFLFTHTGADGKNDMDPMVMVPWLAAAVIVALLGAIIRRKEAIEVPLPSDHLTKASRTEVDGVIAQLDEARAKGELTETRYRNAKAKVLAQAKAKK